MLISPSIVIYNFRYCSNCGFKDAIKATTPYVAGYIKLRENNLDSQVDDLQRMVFLIIANNRNDKLIEKKEKKSCQASPSSPRQT